MASIIPGYEYDIFISYRQKDNKGDKWVSEFVDALKDELESTFKEEVRVYFDINPHDGLLETHDVDASLKEKLKCLVCIPIISLTYCDPKSFAWEHEFKAFIEQASKDHFGLKITLPNGNVANRVLPVRIHDLDIADIKLFESTIGGVLRSVDFVYKETGVNRQLRSKDDDVIKNPNQILYRDQINKVAHAVKDIIESMKVFETHVNEKDKKIQVKESEKVKEPAIGEPDRKEIIKLGQEVTVDKIKPEIERKFPLLKKPERFIPGILIIIVILVALIFLQHHHSKVIWAKEKVLPEIEQRYSELNMVTAFNLVEEAEKYISKDPKFKELRTNIVKKLTILTDPPGADVFIREYSDSAGVWRRLGKTPIDSIKLPKFTFYRVKLAKAGFEDVVAVAPTTIDTLRRKLFKPGIVPPGMVYVEGYLDEVKNIYIKELGFFMDRFEVTNKQFKEFIGKGGYSDQKYWKIEFVKDGKAIIWKDAISEFKDKSDRPGPSTWEAGDYPDGQDDYPVSGISWYEAAAFAEYTGKELPTADHWDSGAGFNLEIFNMFFGSKIFPLSNFNGKRTEKVGKYKGITCYGAYDMAGNVREWCSNRTPIGNIISGGAYDDANYMFDVWSQLPPFDRSSKNGFRCVRYISKDQIPVTAFRQIEFNNGRDFSKERPAAESTFSIYKNQFLYDKTDLNAKIEKRDDSPKDWIIEKITFNAAYGNERMIAYLYLPKNAVPPYQTLIFFPGSYAESEKDLVTSLNSNWFVDYILKNGRAVIYPVYKGTFERKTSGDFYSHSHQYTERIINMTQDLSRSIDYLETRTDIDTNKLAYYGHSWGGIMGGIIPAVEDRLKVSILVVGGFAGNIRPYPEADQLNYVPRIRIPVLMLNGKYDSRFPYETTVKPFFNALGTPEKDKRLCVYETDHYVPKNEMIKETLNWLDHYLGPVKYPGK